jgi:hypothetical protein
MVLRGGGGEVVGSGLFGKRSFDEEKYHEDEKRALD